MESEDVKVAAESSDPKESKEKLMNDSSKRIPTRQKIAYGFGDFGNGFMFDLGQAYLTKFGLMVLELALGLLVAYLRSPRSLMRSWIQSPVRSLITERKLVSGENSDRL